MPLLVSSLVFNGVRLTAQDSVSAPSIFLPPTAPIPGGIAQPPLSTQVAYVVGFDTDLRGRSYRGRNYLPGIPEGDQVAPGVTNAAAAGGFVAAYAALAAVETSQNVTHVVTSHFNGGLARAAGVNTEVTGYRGDLAFDTQRRRSVGRGA